MALQAFSLPAKTWKICQTSDDELFQKMMTLVKALTCLLLSSLHFWLLLAYLFIYSFPKKKCVLMFTPCMLCMWINPSLAEVVTCLHPMTFCHPSSTSSQWNLWHKYIPKQQSVKISKIEGLKQLLDELSVTNICILIK